MVGQGMFMLRCGARSAAKPTLPHNIRLTGASYLCELVFQPPSSYSYSRILSAKFWILCRMNL